MNYKNYMRLLTSIFCVAILSVSFSLFAQDEVPVATGGDLVEEQDGQKDKKTMKLNKVVVTATKTEEKLKDVPVNLEVITDLDIQETGALSVGDIIGQKVTGHYHRYSGLLQPVGLRGGRSDSHGDDIKGGVLILIDGHRVGTGNMGKIPPEMIERIEIIKGPASALYGSAAVGGVINIITKKGKGELKNTVRGEYGSFDYMRGAATSGGSIADWFSYFVSASYMKIDDYVTKDYGKAYNSDEKYIQTGGNLSFFPTSNQDLRIGFSYSDLESHSPSWDSGTTYTRYDKNEEDYADKSRGHADAEYNLRLMNEKLNWKAMGYYLWDRNQWFSGDTASGYDVEDSYSRYEDTTIGTDQQFTISLIPHNKFVVGYTCEALEKRSDKRYNAQPSRPYTPGMEYMTNSVYAQDSIDLFDNSLNLVVGARYDKFDLTTKRPDSGTYDYFVEKREDYDHFSPRGGIVYKITDFLRVRGNVGQAFKTPSADKLSAEHVTTSSYGTVTRILGNPDLKPETSTTYEGGFDVYPEDLNIGATYSFTRTKDKIVDARNTVSHLGEDWATYENLGKTEFQTIDCYVEWGVGDTFNLPIGVDVASNITFNLKYEDLDPDPGVDEKLYFVSNREAKSNLKLSYDRAAVTLFHVFVGKQNIQNWTTFPAAIEEKDSFSFYNLTLNVEILPFLKLDGGIYNLTDKHYEWVRGFPMAERNYRIGVTGIF